MSPTKTHTCYHIHTTPELTEILPAYLEGMPFNAFEETETGLKAYLEQHAIESAVEADLEALREKFEFTFYKEVIKNENWNHESD